MVEFGKWCPVELSHDELGQWRSFSNEIKLEYGLRSDPFRFRKYKNRIIVRAENVAGIVRLGSKQFEIRPKYLGGSSSGHGWKSAFFRILIALEELPSLNTVLANQGELGLIDTMASILDNGLNYADTEGMPRSYVREQGPLDHVKGSIRAVDSWRRLIEPDRIYCSFDYLSEDVPTNRLLKWATQEMRFLASEVYSSRLDAHFERMSNISNVVLSREEVDRIEVPQSHMFLADAVAVAKILHSSSSVDPSSADNSPASAFLWNTAVVFEAFVSLVWDGAARILGGSVSKRGYVLGKSSTGAFKIPTYPDVRFDLGSTTAILDAKYKRFTSYPKTSDVYQVMAASRLMKSRGSALVYPSQHSLRSPRTWLIGGAGFPSYLHAIPIDIGVMSNEDGLHVLINYAMRVMQNWCDTDGMAVDDNVITGGVEGLPVFGSVV